MRNNPTILFFPLYFFSCFCLFSFVWNYFNTERCEVSLRENANDAVSFFFLHFVCLESVLNPLCYGFIESCVSVRDVSQKLWLNLSLKIYRLKIIIASHCIWFLVLVASSATANRTAFWSLSLVATASDC